MAGFGVVIETYHVSPVRNPSFMQQRHYLLKISLRLGSEFMVEPWSWITEQSNSWMEQCQSLALL
jgi:hypothetical protein